MMIKDVEGDVVTVTMTQREYVLVMASLREITQEMSDSELDSRVGASRSELTGVCKQMVLQGREVGVEE